jgi:hypothetical protein
MDLYDARQNGVELYADHFEMHRYDSGTPEKPMLEVVLHLQPKSGDTNLKALAETIQKELRVSPIRTYQNGVDEGRYMPLVCKVLLTEASDKKHKRMFKH